MLTISGAVQKGAKFNSLCILVHRYGVQKRKSVVAVGWIKPIPENLKWKVKLKAPKQGLIVIEVLGVKTGGPSNGEVVAKVSKTLQQQQ
jgi:hypothetical protein